MGIVGQLPFFLFINQKEKQKHKVLSIYFYITRFAVILRTKCYYLSSLFINIIYQYYQLLSTTQYYLFDILSDVCLEVKTTIISLDLGSDPSYTMRTGRVVLHYHIVLHRVLLHLDAVSIPLRLHPIVGHNKSLHERSICFHL